MQVAFLGIEGMADVGLLAQGGLNETFGPAVSAWSVGTGEPCQSRVGGRRRETEGSDSRSRCR
jgi:hypothetical protein